MLQDLNAIQASLSSGELSLENLVQSYIDNIHQFAHLNAMVNVFEEYAFDRVKILEKKKNDGEKLGKLFGAVITIKDNIVMAGMPATAGSNILKGYKSPFSSTAVTRLLEEDAIIIGTTNCDQFGMGSTSKNSAYGSVKNGKDENLIAGGSSGGAAVSVQMNMCLIALGSDTGGSVRQPASLCDIIGFKPSYGAVSRWGLIAYGSSFDVIGLFSHNIANIAACFDVIKGKDEYDSTMIDISIEPKNVKKIAIVSEMFDPNNPFTEQVKNAAFDVFGKEHFSEVNFDFMKYLIPCYYILTTAEASSNLSRFDGVRYGHRAENAENLQDLYTRSRTEGFGEEVKKRIMLGTFVLSEGYFDAYYTKAQKVRRMIVDQVNQILEDHDSIIMPVTPAGAWRHDEKVEDPIQIYLSDVFTVLANITGMPAISIPVDFQGEKINLQVMTKKGSDISLIQSIQKLFDLKN
jgi:aspartyl-tRNA(Asn)/glutamyl-tRNA(Gln) amidotransferase subunit A